MGGLINRRGRQRCQDCFGQPLLSLGALGVLGGSLPRELHDTSRYDRGHASLSCNAETECADPIITAGNCFTAKRHFVRFPVEQFGGNGGRHYHARSASLRFEIITSPNLPVFIRVQLGAVTAVALTFYDQL